MRFLAFALAVMATFASFGINLADSVTVYFRAGHRQFDPSLGENRPAMDSFIAKVREAAAAGDIERIEVRGYASPEGKGDVNDHLALNRCVAIADYIASHAGVSRELITENPEGVAWGELRRLVAETPDVPSRDKIIEILDNTPLWIFSPDGKIIGGRKRQLMALQGGRPYNWMLANLFPQMRNVVAVALCLKEQPAPVATGAAGDNVSSSVPMTAIMQSSAIDVHSSSAGAEDVAATDSIQTATDADAAAPVIEYDYHPHHFALKTNLLFDAVLMPNLELQWLINNHWSVSVEGNVAWWKPRYNKVYRLAVISPEVRYHIRPRAPMHGMYVGVFGGGGLYQLENGGDGYRGEGGMGGVSFGYMWPIGKHFSLEAGIGAGYMSTRYKVYENREGHKLYMRTKSLNYFGPLKLKFSIAWRFDIMTKTVKDNSTL